MDLKEIIEEHTRTMKVPCAICGKDRISIKTEIKIFTDRKNIRLGNMKADFTFVHEECLKEKQRDEREKKAKSITS